MQLQQKSIYCPYCGESIDILIDSSEHTHSYIEDCQVCCRPIEFAITHCDNDEIMVSVKTDND